MRESPKSSYWKIMLNPGTGSGSVQISQVRQESAQATEPSGKSHGLGAGFPHGKMPNRVKSGSSAQGGTSPHGNCAAAPIARARTTAALRNPEAAILIDSVDLSTGGQQSSGILDETAALCRRWIQTPIEKLEAGASRLHWCRFFFIFFQKQAKQERKTK